MRQTEQHVRQLSDAVQKLASVGEQVSAHTANVENGVARLHTLVDGA